MYGNPASLPVAEDALCEPISPYGFHKAACELIAREYSQCFGLTTVVCRIFSLFGSRQRRLLAWEIYSQLAGKADALELQGTGTETRDFLHIDDLSLAILMLTSAVPRGACTILNAGSGRETPIMELAETMRAMVAPAKKITCRGVSRPGDPHRWCADTHEIQSLIPQWQPQTLAAGLEATIQAWRHAQR